MYCSPAGFPTYDGAVDPLNWLNRCEQFFRGQRTLAWDRTWIASYHLTGAAQTWYYALEQDEGMPMWERFRELCSLRFGLTVRGTWGLPQFAAQPQPPAFAALPQTLAFFAAPQSPAFAALPQPPASSAFLSAATTPMILASAPVVAPPLTLEGWNAKLDATPDAQLPPSATSEPPPSPPPPPLASLDAWEEAAARQSAAAAQRQTAAAIRLQAAVRGLLVCRRLQEMRARKMCRQTLEAAVAAVVLGIRGRDFAMWDGGRRAVSTREQGAFLASGGLLLVVGEGAQPCATAFRYRPPRGRLRGSLMRTILGGHPGAPLSSRWRPWDPGGCTYAGPTRGGRPSYLRESKIGRDVKGLFLSVRFVFSGVIFIVIVRLQLEDELPVEVGCSVRDKSPC